MTNSLGVEPSSSADTQSAGKQYDALLVLSFGGPESNEEVVPFLENVTRGRGIPRERLEVVGQHYFHFGGKSPLNDLNREIIANLDRELHSRGYELPIYYGNRNWHPFAADTAEQMAADGVRNALVLATSAWGGYSACRQYDEDIVAMREHLAAQNLPEIDFTKLRQFYDHPLFIQHMAQGLREGLDSLADAALTSTAILFTAHSVPLAQDAAGGAEGDKHLYSRQVAQAARLVASEAGIGSAYELVWQSRSGNPHTPWLEPDIVARTLELQREQGITTVVVCPIGFISDHMEVVWDLDTELVQAAKKVGVTVVRTPTIGPTPAFAQLVADLVDEASGTRTPADPGKVTVMGCTRNGAPCAAGCCEIPRRPAASHASAPAN